MVESYLRPGDASSRDTIYVEEAAWAKYTEAAAAAGGKQPATRSPRCSLTPDPLRSTPDVPAASEWRLERQYKEIVVYHVVPQFVTN